MKHLLIKALTKSIDNEYHLSQVSKTLKQTAQVKSDQASMGDLAKDIYTAIEQTKGLSEKQKETYKRSFNEELKNSANGDKKKNDKKKYYVAIFNNDGEIVRVRRLFSERRANEVIEENEAFGYTAQRGFLGRKDNGLTWRRMGNHPNQGRKTPLWVDTKLIV